MKLTLISFILGLLFVSLVSVVVFIRRCAARDRRLTVDHGSSKSDDAVILQSTMMTTLLSEHSLHHPISDPSQVAPGLSIDDPGPSGALPPDHSCTDFCGHHHE